MDRFDLHIDAGKDGFGFLGTLPSLADILRRISEDWAQMGDKQAGQPFDLNASSS
jgi:hypothetical protein